MASGDFVHLHLHTEYSLLDAACPLERLMTRAAALKLPALAMTDHGVMHGAIEFYEAARSKGIKPILGCEVYVAPGSRLDKKPGSGMRDVYHHLVLLAKNTVGYHNLIKLVTAANLEGFYYKPRIDKELLARHSEGLIALSGCLASEVSEAILKGDERKARDTIDWFKQTLGPDNYYLELQNHGIPEQARVNRALIPWSKDFGLKLVASNDVHYVERAHWKAHDCLICIGTQSLVSDSKRMRYQPEQFYLRSADEMRALFAETPEAVANTVEVAEKCNLEIRFGKGAEHYPVFQPPEVWTREGFLRKLLCDGLRKRYTIEAEVVDGEIVVRGIQEPSRLDFLLPSASGDAIPPEPVAHPGIRQIFDRLHLELGVIEKTGYVSYFLIVGDFVRWGRDNGIACVARGSAAGSMVTYLLEIANVDPLRYGLLFERFLNPERVSPPDIDIDFADDRRGEVIEYVRNKYGRDAVAQIITFGTLGAKSVIRDVGRVMGLSFGECDRLAKMISDAKWGLSDALEKNSDFKTAYESEEVTHELVDVALILENQARSAGVHAAGVVIGAQPLVNLLPLKQDDDGGIVTQYAMDPVGKLGLLKMDFLGLKTLTVLRNTVELVQRTRGLAIDLDNLPLDDQKTYALLNNAQTLGVFQLESGGMRDLCKKFQIASVEHITALISLYRPGPLDTKLEDGRTMLTVFVDRKNDRDTVSYPHPDLEPILKETYGVIVYQEQVMQCAQILAGYTLGGADLLRRAMGKKKPEEMAKQREIFVKGCAEKSQVPAPEANEVFDLLEKFARYGFNKSHAAAYAVVAYQTAYLKANFPVEFLSAMMTNDQADLSKLAQYIAEAKGFGIEVLGPDVNESDVSFAPAAAGGDATPRIRFGLAAIKGVGEVAVQSILDARQSGGRFTSLNELCERVDTRAANKKVLECLIKAGACDALGPNRATLMATLDAAMARATSIASDRVRGQSSLFDSFDVVPKKSDQRAVELPEWPVDEKLAAEKELLGMYLSGHPLQPFESLLQRYTLQSIAELSTLENRAMARVGGMVSALQEGISKKSGKKYAMVTIEDLTGTVQMLLMNENFDRFRSLLTLNKPVLVIAEVNTGEDKPKLFPQEILGLEDAPRRYTKQVHLRLRAAELDRTRLEAVRNLVEAHRGNVPLFLSIRMPSGPVVFLESNEHFSVAPSVLLEEAVNSQFGAGTYWAKPDTSLPERAPRKWERRNGNGGGGGDE